MMFEITHIRKRIIKFSNTLNCLNYYKQGWPFLFIMDANLNAPVSLLSCMGQ